MLLWILGMDTKSGFWSSLLSTRQPSISMLGSDLRPRNFASAKTRLVALHNCVPFGEANDHVLPERLHTPDGTRVRLEHGNILDDEIWYCKSVRTGAALLLPFTRTYTLRNLCRISSWAQESISRLFSLFSLFMYRFLSLFLYLSLRLSFSINSLCFKLYFICILF